MSVRRAIIKKELPSDAVELTEYTTVRTRYEFVLYYSKSEDAFYQKVNTGYSLRKINPKTNMISIKLNNGMYGYLNIYNLKDVISDSTISNI